MHHQSLHKFPLYDSRILSCLSPLVSRCCNSSLKISSFLSRYITPKSRNMPIPRPDLRPRCHGRNLHFDTVHMRNIHAQKCPSNRTMVCCRGCGMFLLETQYRQHLQQTSFCIRRMITNERYTNESKSETIASKVAYAMSLPARRWNTAQRTVHPADFHRFPPLH